MISSLLALALGVTGGFVATAAPALASPPVAAASTAAVETRQFTGHGSSSFGFALDYARADARRQAEAAGFYDCTEIFVWDPSPYTAMVIWECTR